VLNRQWTLLMENALGLGRPEDTGPPRGANELDREAIVAFMAGNFARFFAGAGDEFRTVVAEGDVVVVEHRLSAIGYRLRRSTLASTSPGGPGHPAGLLLAAQLREAAPVIRNNFHPCGRAGILPTGRNPTIDRRCGMPISPALWVCAQVRT
jgi:hypothetical protein